jgi:hypothetical protein
VARGGRERETLPLTGHTGQVTRTQSLILTRCAVTLIAVGLFIMLSVSHDGLIFVVIGAVNVGIGRRSYRKATQPLD